MQIGEIQKELTFTQMEMIIVHDKAAGSLQGSFQGMFSIMMGFLLCAKAVCTIQNQNV